MTFERPLLHKKYTTLIMAVVASVFKVGWCLMSSSTALPKLDAVSPEPKHTTCHPLEQIPQAKIHTAHRIQSNSPSGSELRRRRIAGK